MSKSCISFLAVLFCLAACKPKHYSASQFPDKYIITGSFGGFSGMKTSTYILPNGQVFAENSFENKKEEMPMLEIKAVKDIFKKADKINWNNLPADDFGNMSWYLSYHTRDTTLTSVWGSKGNTPPVQVSEVYHLVNELLTK